ncbi:hypothetical protein ZIOFF_029369 [Zingiber officinale]|uniref:WRC domain-containing protein n=1 Tax=Zingiber officinale TaxID=94328 RepID=A0A8J5GPF9_ZINOF|nr:hypothetical protein ZIOFF_029369 [Zingiber officinale]
MPQPRRLYDDSDAVPGEGDAFRCRRSDGKKWRCRKRVMDGLSFCEYHYVQIRANLERHKASAANPRNRARKAEAPAEEDPIAAAPKRRRVKPAAEKERQKGEEEDKEAGTTRVLPNGLMTIVATTSPSGGHGGYESGSVGPKVGFDEGRLLTRRRIRSKNAEPIPVATIKKIPCGKKRICHSCREKNVLGMVRCLSCRKRSFCSRCLKKRCKQSIAESELEPHAKLKVGRSVSGRPAREKGSSKETLTTDHEAKGASRSFLSRSRLDDALVMPKLWKI